ncbi:transglycosylase SLT domain-containing protein [Streptomyces roseicoloratus]|uniref:Transglycosylase SLT domain-containing protein n=1 Tax=Streptomyces roseicoloratus TaxID=2508722 RepID=A0ABY9RZ65_9ACTN|nr:transglycosylase SLT domain-containing protein [Streptomyces roseicoloratus]WMX47282.1 transglycosylase SLT domain-containing protein [Streptomyces roseicoloratus]
MFRSIATRAVSRKKTFAVSAAVLIGASGAVLGNTGTASAATPQEIARKIVPPAQFASFSKIVEHESGWNHTATNSSSGAYGLVQALPASKMASAGSDWKTNPATQIKWGLEYMNERYGSPNGAWNFWQTHGWY